jgi:Tol biopolymer transport system component
MKLLSKQVGRQAMCHTYLAAFASALILFATAGLASHEQKKGERFKIRRLTQGMGLHQIGPVSPDGKAIVLIAQKPERAPNLYLMQLSDFSISPPLTNLKWGVVDASWSPDGKMLALTGFGETASFADIYTLDLSDNKLRQLTHNNFSDKEPVFTPDSKRLLYSSDESPLPDAAFGILHVASIPVGGGKPEFFTEDEGPSAQPQISPDGKSVLLIKIEESSGRHSLWQYEFNGKPLRSLTSNKLARIHRYIANAASGCIVLWAQEQPEQQDEIYILDLKSGELRPLPDPDSPKRNPTVSPNGKLIAYISPTDRGDHLFLFDSASGALQQLTYKGTRTYSPVFISNTAIAFGSDRDKSEEIYLLDLSSAET